MGNYVIKSNRTNKHLKSIDLENGKLEFTSNREEAIKYGDSWKPGTELENLRFNFRNDYPILDEMSVEYYNGDYVKYEEDAAEAPEIGAFMPMEGAEEAADAG